MHDDIRHMLNQLEKSTHYTEEAQHLLHALNLCYRIGRARVDDHNLRKDMVAYHAELHSYFLKQHIPLGFDFNHGYRFLDTCPEQEQSAAAFPYIVYVSLKRLAEKRSMVVTTEFFSPIGTLIPFDHAIPAHFFRMELLVDAHTRWSMLTGEPCTIHIPLGDTRYTIEIVLASGELFTHGYIDVTCQQSGAWDMTNFVCLRPSHKVFVTSASFTQQDLYGRLHGQMGFIE